MTEAAVTPPEDPLDESNVLSFQSSDDTRDTSNDIQPFRLEHNGVEDPHVLIARRPKQAVMLELAKGATSDDDMELLGLWDRFIDTVLDADSAAHLRARFLDPEDTLDIDSMDRPMKALVGLWYGRPTGQPGALSGRQRRTGRASTVRRRGKG